MNMNIQVGKEIILVCKKHGQLVNWRELSLMEGGLMTFSEYLELKKWAFDSGQVETQYYCPECRKENKMPIGRVDTRQYI